MLVAEYVFCIGVVVGFHPLLDIRRCVLLGLALGIYAFILDLS